MSSRIGGVQRKIVDCLGKHGIKLYNLKKYYLIVLYFYYINKMNSEQMKALGINEVYLPIDGFE